MSSIRWPTNTSTSCFIRGWTTAGIRSRARCTENHMEKYQLDLPIVLPQMEADDECVPLLTQWLDGVRGVEKAHVVRDNGTAKLCLHFDANLVPLPRLQRLVEDAGAKVTDRYRHQALPFEGLDAGDAADALTARLDALPGMLHANANYAAGLIFIAYDSHKLARSEIDAIIHKSGATLLPESEVAVAPAPPSASPAKQSQQEAPADPLSWIRHNWSLVLVALAGVFLVIGWAGSTFFAMPANFALVFYLLSYVAGGYDVATHAVPGLLRGQFDTDVLMLAAALAQPFWASGPKAHSCSSSSPSATPASTMPSTGRATPSARWAS